ncbi:MAG: crotonase/enoyl-CoA hydratase family protein [Gammaproteobacteria bacterium]|nr:crotonase/enoyl-CoA hydratase family protein [Gammaproteobacteria bacterium]
MSERVTIDIDNHVATVTLNRPEKKNAVDLKMFDAIAAAAAELAEDNSVRAVVLRGEGSDFCAGIDVSVFSADGIGAMAVDLLEPSRDSGANYFQHAATCWRDLPVPVIAVLHGAVFGAGLQIAMGADLRYASADARLSIMEIRWGLIPDMAISATLPATVAEDRVRELAYTGKVINAGEAAAIGLLTAVVDEPLATATALAHEIAGRSPDAIRAIKKLVSAAWRGRAAEMLRLEAELQAAVMAGDNQKEAARANLEKRPPRFRDPDRDG